MFIVNIEFFGQLSAAREKKLSLQLEQPCTVEQVVKQLGVDPEEVGFVVIDGVQSEMQAALTSDCRLAIFPYITGG
jgi:hypothetical protein